MSRSFQLDRRALLRGAGVSIALPWLEAMNLGAAEKKQPAVRLCSILFPFGVALRPDDDPERDWGWFPRGSGADYQLTRWSNSSPAKAANDTTPAIKPAKPLKP